MSAQTPTNLSRNVFQWVRTPHSESSLDSASDGNVMLYTLVTVVPMVVTTYIVQVMEGEGFY